MSTLADAYDDSAHRTKPAARGRAAAGGGGGAPTVKSPLPNWLDYVVTLLPAEVLALHTTGGTEFFENLTVEGDEQHFWLFGLAAAVFYVVGRISTKGYKSLLDAMGRKGGDLEKERRGFALEPFRIAIPAVAMWSWLLLGGTSEAKAAFNDDRTFLYGWIALLVAAGAKVVTDRWGWKAQ
jgi:hypothetical protein